MINSCIIDFQLSIAQKNSWKLLGSLTFKLIVILTQHLATRSSHDQVLVKGEGTWSHVLFGSTLWYRHWPSLSGPVQELAVGTENCSGYLQTV